MKALPSLGRVSNGGKMKDTKDIPVSCSRCIEKVLQDSETGKELNWESYGRQMPHCKECLDALKEKLEGSEATGTE